MTDLRPLNKLNQHRQVSRGESEMMLILKFKSFPMLHSVALSFDFHEHTHC